VPGSWPVVKPDTLTDKVYDVLREKVISGEMAPGEFIREQEVSERLGVSRTPVREALARLASETFLERIPHRGFRLPEEAITDLIELYPIITALEVLATKEALSLIDAELIGRLREINSNYKDAYEAKEVYAGIDFNHEFHDLLSERSGNKRLYRMLHELRSKVRGLEIWAFSDIGHWETSIQEHEAVLAAIERKDFPSALEVLEKNRLTTYREFIKHAAHEDGAEKATEDAG
jgi:DNA-binding GntR family transcriptional regulator